MDFRLYARVLWRFRLLVVVGLLLAIALAMLSVVRVSPDGLKYRQTELWSSTTRLGVTQKGFPWGRLLAQDPSLGPRGGRATRDPARRPEPAQQSGRPLRRARDERPRAQLMRRDGPIGGKSSRRRSSSQDGRYQLPLIDVTAIATSPRGAMRLAARSANALRDVPDEQQRATKCRRRTASSSSSRTAARRRDLPAALEDDADRDLPRGDVRHGRSRVPARERAAAGWPASRGRDGKDSIAQRRSA